jgi:hypothetical protein
MMMAEASFSGTLRVIAIIILSYYLLKFLFRIFAPILIQQVVKKAERNFYEQQQNMYNRQQEYADNTPEKPKEKKKVGEYIDYEEIE